MDSGVILRAADRFCSVAPGVTSWHCFSAGAHYDPSNVSWGMLVGLDEHHVDPGAGFDWHAHRGVTIVSRVVSGALRHQDDTGDDRIVRPGAVFEQHAGAGLRHRETNAGGVGLRLVQMTVLGDEPAPSRFAVWSSGGPLGGGRWFVFVLGGAWTLGGTLLSAGDSARDDRAAAVTGAGELLVWRGL